MCKNEELKFMVITEWLIRDVAKEVADKIAIVREQASEEFDNVMFSSHAEKHLHQDTIKKFNSIKILNLY